MKTRTRTYFAIAGALALTACATQYQPRGMTGGFSETQLGPNAFTVTFKGNGYTDFDRATDFTLLRSAELTLGSGFRYFVIVDANSWQQMAVMTTPTHTTTTLDASTTGTLNSYGGVGTFRGTTTGTARSTTWGGNSFLIQKPRTSNTIVCFAQPPQAVGMVYDAEFVRTALTAKYHIGQ
ncbi:MAG: hypothetical protein HY943_13165 [Gammaproteobacteria bacterium]|nr:hypothetical protein [Gammaproteobacteria bacterium]